jgi:hypothetical protein
MSRAELVRYVNELDQAEPGQLEIRRTVCISIVCVCYTPCLIVFQMITDAGYGAGNMVSPQGDVYSYGILVLKTVTGKRPTDSTFRQGSSLREYVDLALQNRAMDGIDTRLSLDLGNEPRDRSSFKRQISCIHYYNRTL